MMGKCGKPRPYDAHKQKGGVNQKNPMNDIPQKKLHEEPTLTDLGYSTFFWNVDANGN